MKFQWDRKYTTIAIYCFLVILASSTAIIIISNFGAIGNFFKWFLGIVGPFLGGLVIAYMLNPIILTLESRLLKSIPKKKHRRTLSMLITFTAAFIILGTLIMNIIPQLQESIVSLISNSKTYIGNLNSYFLDLAEENPWLQEPFDSAVEYLEEFIKNSSDIIKNIVPTVLSITTSVSNIVIAVISSIYLLSSKEKMLSQMKKIIFAIFTKPVSDRIFAISSFANNCFSKFISGQIYVSLITGIITFIVATIMNAPFPLIMSFIIGLTNIIPFFGPIIGSVLSIFIILLIDPVKALWFGIFIIVLQQIDSNIISPRIIGDSIGLAPFWVMFSIIVSGAIFGFAGLIFGVPLFTVIYTIIRMAVNDKLAQRGFVPYDNEFFENYRVYDSRFSVPDEIKTKRMGGSPLKYIVNKINKLRTKKKRSDDNNDEKTNSRND